jgi:methionyl-tRNA formyltransferase
MGTPEFAVASLDILLKNNYNIVAVITVPDKPAGRGQQMHESAVKEYAQNHQLKVLQPQKLKDEEFITELKSLSPDLGVVVAFRMLPEIVWNMPNLGTFNLHASLLPQYRGAAPINWAIINGEKKTGVTTFFLQHEIDTGNIIFQEEVFIGENETAGEMHDLLMNTGAKLVLKTVRNIEEGNIKTIRQSELILNKENLKIAPKIFKEDCKINWEKPIEEIHNFVRGLSPYPAAWTEFNASDHKSHVVKIYSTLPEIKTHHFPCGQMLSDGKNYLKVAVKGGFISILNLQLAGKNRMNIRDFLRGFKLQALMS